MTNRARIMAVCGSLLCLTACASIHADRFYALQALPSAPILTRQQLPMAVSLRVTLPSLVDRSQLVISEGNGIILLEHDRWASPLVDQMGQILGQDLEQRLGDILITTLPLSQSMGMGRATIHVDVVELTLPRGRRPITLEARWQVDIAGDQIARTGRQVFTATPKNSSAAALAASVSDCVSALADQLAPTIGMAANTQP